MELKEQYISHDAHVDTREKLEEAHASALGAINETHTHIHTHTHTDTLTHYPPTQTQC